MMGPTETKLFSANGILMALIDSIKKGKVLLPFLCYKHVAGYFIWLLIFWDLHITRFLLKGMGS